MKKPTPITTSRTTALAIIKTDADDALVVREPSPPPALSPTSRMPSLTPPRKPMLPTLKLPKPPKPPALPGVRNVRVSRTTVEIVTNADDFRDVDDFPYMDDFMIEDDWSPDLLIDGPGQQGKLRNEQNNVKLLGGTPTQSKQIDTIKLLPYSPPSHDKSR